MARFGTIRYGQRMYAESIAQTPAEVYDRMSWEREPGDTIVLDGTTGFGEVELVPDRVHPFQIEVRTAAGVLVAQLTNWWSDGAGLRQTRYDGNTLRFSMLYDNPQRVYLRDPYVLWLRDRWGHVVDQFLIKQRAPRQDGDLRTIDVTGSCRLTQLAREVVLELVVPEGLEQTIEWIVEKLLDDFQVQTPAITLGGIDSAIGAVERSLSVSRWTVLGVIRHLQSLQPMDQAGFIYIDAQNRLWWKLELGERRDQRLVIAGNMTGVQQDENWDAEDFFTRLYMYGAGDDPATQLSLIDAGEEVPYLDADTQGAPYNYGIRPYVKTDNRVKYPSTLLAMAQRYLEEAKHPPCSYSVSMIDLAQSQTPGIGEWPDLYIGAPVRIEAADIGVDVSLYMVTIERSLMDALDMRVELSNRSGRLADLFKNLREQMNPPLDVMDDGSRYPKIARLVTGDETAEEYPDLEYRDGDWRDNAGEMEYYDTGDWHAVAADIAFSESNPADVSTTAGQGAGSEVNRAGHVHALAANTVRTLGFAAFWTGATFATMPTVGVVNGDRGYVGESPYYCVVRHQGAWQRIPFLAIATTRAGLTGLFNGQVGWATTEKMFFGYLDGAWRALWPWRAATRAELPGSAVVAEGEYGFTTGDNHSYVFSGAGWRSVHAFLAADKTALAALAIANGETGYGTTSHRKYECVNSVLVCITNLEA